MRRDSRFEVQGSYVGWAWPTSASGQQSAASISRFCSFPIHHSSLITHHSPSSSRSAFTLIELLVAIAIIGILSAMMLGAIGAARDSSRAAATKSTIAKLNAIIMARYESYMTRRVPIVITAGTNPNPKVVALLRLYALRDLMRMEMPDSIRDIDGYTGSSKTITAETTISGTTVSGTATLSYPSLHTIYAADLPTTNYESAQCLYKVVSIGSPEAMEQFAQSEIGTVSDGTNSYPVFIDGWGTPICWLRWAPGYNRPLSDIQNNNPDADSDPFDPRRVDVNSSTPPVPRGYHLIPLICSAGPDKLFGLNEVSSSARSVVVTDVKNLFDQSSTTLNYHTIGVPCDEKVGDKPLSGTHYDNITNHHIEMR